MTDNDLKEALRRLPLESADRASWNRIVARADALGIAEASSPTAGRQPWQWLAAAAAVAAIAVAIMSPEEITPSAPPARVVETGVVTDDATLDVLMRHSQLLETWLRYTPEPPRVVTVGTASRETAVRERIAAIDWQLSAGKTELEPAVQAALWGERSQLMGELVALRYQRIPRSDL
ncbi:MAG: hypothetical protein AAGH76_07350 [Pseudomonadota bacterium]